MNSVPMDFWYAATILLAGILVWVITNFIGWLRSTVNELKNNVGRLINIAENHTEDIHENREEIKNVKHQIKNVEDDITELKKRRR